MAELNLTPKKYLLFAIVLLGLVSTALGLFILLPVIIPVAFWLNHSSDKAFKIFLLEYQDFLNENEGQAFFCYTSRKNKQSLIEQNLLPELPKDIEIIFLHGKKPISNFPEKFISHALYKINNVGFPNVMKIIDGQVKDASLHENFYAIINQNQDMASFINIVHTKLKSLEH